MIRNYNIITLHALVVLSSIVGFNSSTKNGDTKCKEGERHTLLTFKQDLQDDYGILSTWNDGPNEDCCKWKGVQCNNQTGYVEKLNLPGLKGHGEMYHSITELQHLKYLYLSGVQILNDSSHHALEFLVNLKSLEELYLINCSLSHETWTLPRLSFLIHDTAESIDASFQRTTNTHHNRMVRWNNENFNCHVLNVDGSCLGVPVRAGFGGVIRNSSGFYLSGFSGFIPNSTDILFAELTAIYRGLLLAVETGLEELVCYTDSLLSMSLITGHASNFHVYAVLIQDIKDLLSSRNFTILHCLREGNQCADYMAKLGANSNQEFSYHATPPGELLPLIRNDAMGTFFPRA